MSSFRASLFGAVLSVTAVLASTRTSAGATRVDLDGDWRFAIDGEKAGVRRGWTKAVPDGVETVRVPHTWNVGRYDDYEGTAWYFKKFLAPAVPPGGHVELHFGATFYRSRVWLNGVLLGGHEGGHTAYFFDVTPHLQPSNTLAVEIDNQPGVDTIPGWALKLESSNNIWYDWWHYGGIVRDVFLAVNEAAFVRRQQIRTKLDGVAAVVTDRVFLENTSPRPFSGKLVVAAYPEGGGAAVASVERQLRLAPGAHDTSVEMRIDRVRRWHVDDPQLYRLEATVVDGKGRPVDQRADTFGARSVEIRDRKLYLNGEHVRLTGMARHEDGPVEGLAESVGTMRRDYDDMKRLHVTLTRPVHYPQHPFILDYCDRNGILLIPEIPVWQFSEKQMTDPKVLALAEQMLTEMIEQDGNHPSIFAWSVSNESASGTPGGAAYFKRMYALAKSIDPDRFVSFADDQLGGEGKTASQLSDFVMMNQYVGTWHGSESQLPSVLDEVGRKYADKMVIISEFGTPGIFARDAAAADALRVAGIRSQLRVMEKYDWIGGAIFWSYADYKSHRNLWPGQTAGVVDHGLVDWDRQRRPSYEVWREETAPARVEVVWDGGGPAMPVGFSGTVSARRADELPSYPLHGYRIRWEARDDAGQKAGDGEAALSDIGAAAAISGRWEGPKRRGLALHVEILAPTGFVAAEKDLFWWEPRPGGLDLGVRNR
jgi:beta-glucuronidase